MAPQNSEGVRTIKLPRHNLRQTARVLLKLSPPSHVPTANPKILDTPVKLVCISDTHNNQPQLPDGDILLHAGDLTETGTFTELQNQIDWLKSQPHPHKVVIAGNHDILLDEAFLKAHSENGHVINATKDGKTAADLDWGHIIYLNDSAITLEIEAKIITTSERANHNPKPNTVTTPHPNPNPDPDPKPKTTTKPQPKTLKIYGSPKTPCYGLSAFQYPTPRGKAYTKTELSTFRDPWSNTLPSDTDILLTHGPPRSHLDGGLRAGCAMLAHEIERVRPRFVVFGHVHVGFGVERDVRLDGVRRRYEGILRAEKGWEGIVGMVGALGWIWGMWMVQCVFEIIGYKSWRVMAIRKTTFVNAAVVGEGNRVVNEAVVLYV